MRPAEGRRVGKARGRCVGNFRVARPSAPPTFDRPTGTARSARPNYAGPTLTPREAEGHRQLAPRAPDANGARGDCWGCC